MSQWMEVRDRCREMQAGDEAFYQAEDVTRYGVIRNAAYVVGHERKFRFRAKRIDETTVRIWCEGPRISWGPRRNHG